MVELNKKINYRKLYKKHPSYFIKLYLLFIFKKRYLVNFIGDSAKIFASWFVTLTFLTCICVSTVATKVLAFLKAFIILSTPLFYFFAYYEVFLWRLPLIYAIDFYFLYFVSQLIEYLERLELLWVHRK